MEFSDPSILVSAACKSHIRAQMLAHNTQALEVVYMWPWHHWQDFWGFQTSTITPTLFLKLNRHSEKSYMSKQLLLAFMMVGYKSQINIWVTEGKSKIKLPVGELGHKTPGQNVYKCDLEKNKCFDDDGYTLFKSALSYEPFRNITCSKY